MGARAKHRWVNLLDGPIGLAGEQQMITRATIAAGLFKVRLGINPDAMNPHGTAVEIHEYRLQDETSARWVRHVETKPLPPLHRTYGGQH